MGKLGGCRLSKRNDSSHVVNLPLDIQRRKTTISDLLENGIPENCSVLEIHTIGATKKEMKSVLEILWYQ